MNRKTLALSKNPKDDKRAVKRASAKREIGAFFDDANTPLPDKKHVSKVTGKHRCCWTSRLESTTMIMQAEVDKQHSQHSPSTGRQMYARWWRATSGSVSANTAPMLTSTVKCTHDDEEQPPAVSVRILRQCWPQLSNVRTMMKSNLRQCLCEYCANVDLNCQMYARWWRATSGSIRANTAPMLT